MTEVAVAGHVLEVGGAGGTLIRASGEPVGDAVLAAALREKPRSAPLGDAIGTAEELTDRVETAAKLYDAIASGKILDPRELEEWIVPSLDLLGRLDRNGRFTEVLELARASYRVLVLVRRWIELIRMLRGALTAARALGDAEALAWAQHELGTLQLAADQLAEADACLTAAHAIRQRIDDRDGLAATEHNLRTLCRQLRDALRQGSNGRALRRLAVAAVALVLLMTGAVAHAVIWPDPIPADTTATLTAEIDGRGSVTGAAAGIECPGTCSAPVALGRRVALVPTAERGATFVEWSGDCSGSGQCTVLMEGPRNVTAHFRTAKTTRTLSVRTEGDGRVTSRPAGIDCPSICATPVRDGAKVRLHAAPNSGATFAGWHGGGCDRMKDDCIVTVRQRTSVTARFVTAPSRSALTVELAGDGSGTVSSEPGGISCGDDCSATFDDGTPVTLTATPREDSEFAGWSGGGCEDADPCVVTLRAATTVTATFTLRRAERYTLTTSIDGEGEVAPDCSSGCPYDAGATQTLTATPADGYEFTGWSGCSAEDGATCTVTMTEHRSVGAVFEAVDEPDIP